MSRTTVAAAYGKGRPLATYRGAFGRPVQLLSAVDRRLPPGFTGNQNLVFEFSGWLVEVDTSQLGADRVSSVASDAELHTWAVNLQASSATGGYVILHPHAPLSLAPRGLTASRSATFGLGEPNGPQGDTLDIEDGYCGQPTSDTATRRRFQTDEGLVGVSWCDGGSGLHVTAIGREQFVDLVSSQLEMIVRPGGPGPARQ